MWDVRTHPCLDKGLALKHGLQEMEPGGQGPPTNWSWFEH